MSVAIVRKWPCRQINAQHGRAERDATPVSLSFASARIIGAYRLRRSQNKVESSRQLFPKENCSEMNRFSGGFNDQAHGND
jgi:hypothetical protein